MTYFTPKEIAQERKVTVQAVYKWINTGWRGVKLRAKFLGGAVRITSRSIDEFEFACGKIRRNG